jgi:hypothetical protein
MPAQQRIRGRNRGDPLQGRAADAVRSGGQPSAIVISQAQSSVPELSTQEPILFDKVDDGVPLSAFQPTGQRDEHHLDGRGGRSRGGAYRGLNDRQKTSAELWDITGPRDEW